MAMPTTKGVSLLLGAGATSEWWSWPEGVSAVLEPDGIGGYLRIVRDALGRVLAGPVADTVLLVRVNL